LILKKNYPFPDKTKKQCKAGWQLPERHCCPQDRLACCRIGLPVAPLFASCKDSILPGRASGGFNSRKSPTRPAFAAGSAQPSFVASTQNVVASNLHPPPSLDTCPSPVNYAPPLGGSQRLNFDSLGMDIAEKAGCD
jgi:hypothetical protein